jgi:hypothetical protein
MTTYTKRPTLLEGTKPLTENDRLSALARTGVECNHANCEENDHCWEATVRGVEDDLQIAERKLSETGQLLFHAKQRIKQLEEKLNDIGHA